jgi:hypothetical protein
LKVFCNIENTLKIKERDYSDKNQEFVAGELKALEKTIGIVRASELLEDTVLVGSLNLDQLSKKFGELSSSEIQSLINGVNILLSESGQFLSYEANPLTSKLKGIKQVVENKENAASDARSLELYAAEDAVTPLPEAVEAKATTPLPEVEAVEEVAGAPVEAVQEGATPLPVAAEAKGTTPLREAATEVAQEAEVVEEVVEAPVEAVQEGATPVVESSKEFRAGEVLGEHLEDGTEPAYSELTIEQLVQLQDRLGEKVKELNRGDGGQREAAQWLELGMLTKVNSELAARRQEGTKAEGPVEAVEEVVEEPVVAEEAPKEFRVGDVLGEHLEDGTEPAYSELTIEQLVQLQDRLGEKVKELNRGDGGQREAAQWLELGMLTKVNGELAARRQEGTKAEGPVEAVEEVVEEPVVAEEAPKEFRVGDAVTPLPEAVEARTTTSLPEAAAEAEAVGEVVDAPAVVVEEVALPATALVENVAGEVQVVSEIPRREQDLFTDSQIGQQELNNYLRNVAAGMTTMTRLTRRDAETALQTINSELAKDDKDREQDLMRRYRLEQAEIFLSKLVTDGIENPNGLLEYIEKDEVHSISEIYASNLQLINNIRK